MSRARRLSSKDKKMARREKEGSRMDTKFSMNQINPLTDNQGHFFDSYNAGYNIAAIGTAGTGKTMCGLYLGLCDILSNDNYHQVIIVRSAVQTREQGFMPGTLQQKEAVYALPYADIVNDESRVISNLAKFLNDYTISGKLSYVSPEGFGDKRGKISSDIKKLVVRDIAFYVAKYFKIFMLSPFGILSLLVFGLNINLLVARIKGERFLH